MSYINNPSTGGSNASDSIVVVPFTYTTASPMVLQAVLVGQIVNRAVVVITTPFNDPSASVQLGVTSTPGLILGVGDVSAGTADQYGSDVLVDFASNDIMILTISPGASTQGSGLLFYRVK